MTQNLSYPRRLAAILFFTACLSAQTSEWRLNPAGAIYFNGSVGIGTNTPQAPIDIGAGTGPRFLLYGTGAAAGRQSGMGVNLGQAANSMGFFLGHDANFSIDVAKASEPFPYAGGYTTKFVLQNDGRVGIGTVAPATTLDVAGDLTLSGHRSILFTTGDNAAEMRGGIQFLTPNNGIDNIWTPTDAAGNPVNHSTVRFGGFGNFNSANVNLLVSGVLGVGTMTPCNHANPITPPECALAVNGAILAKNVVVNTTWADYVFAPGYHLRPLADVADYIRQNHRLPDIPSAQEVEEKGVSLGDMEAKLLAKVEELTLHLIQAEARNQELEQRVARLEREREPRP